MNRIGLNITYVFGNSKKKQKGFTETYGRILFQPEIKSAIGLPKNLLVLLLYSEIPLQKVVHQANKYQGFKNIVYRNWLPRYPRILRATTNRLI